MLNENMPDQKEGRREQNVKDLIIEVLDKGLLGLEETRLEGRGYCGGCRGICGNCKRRCTSGCGAV